MVSGESPAIPHVHVTEPEVPSSELYLNDAVYGPSKGDWPLKTRELGFFCVKECPGNCEGMSRESTPVSHKALGQSNAAVLEVYLTEQGQEYTCGKNRLKYNKHVSGRICVRHP